jgi:hypothetical protein
VPFSMWATTQIIWSRGDSRLVSVEYWSRQQRFRLAYRGGIETRPSDGIQLIASTTLTTSA